MLRYLYDEIHGATKVVFDVPANLTDPIKQLADATPWSLFASWKKESVVGSVSSKRVTLRRHRPFLSNSYALVFRGEFRSDSGQTQLIGAFGLHPYAKWFMTIWFAFILLFIPLPIVLGIAASDYSLREMAIGALAGAAISAGGCVMLLCGIGLLRFGKCLAKDDVSKISAHIESSFADLPAA